MLKRVRQVSFSVTAEEYVALTKQSAEARLNMANYLRRSLGLSVEAQKPKREEDPYEHRAKRGSYK